MANVCSCPSQTLACPYHCFILTWYLFFYLKKLAREKRRQLKYFGLCVSSPAWLRSSQEGDDSCSDEEIEVVPSTWLIDGDEYAFWPTISSKGSTTDKRTRLIMSLADPQPEWPKRKIRLRHSYGELS